ncbi:M4 family metallopeptidase [Aequorivita capsosiphonis]|uniref:M4 family metallopeptidase n=1 Tax=Aequorivita capsosiphonis TaxID=487317 RepID=UPI0003F85EF7|nr:M4 family metallopeptidase [Aequorivita capsosiphonis]
MKNNLPVYRGLFFSGIFCLLSIFSTVGQNKISKATIVPQNDGLIILESSKQFSLQNKEQLFEEVFNAPDNVSFMETKTEQDNLGYTHIKMQQYFNNIKVEYGTIQLHSKQANVKSITSEYRQIASDFSTQVAISAPRAFDFAIAHINAEHYLWDFPEIAARTSNYQKPEGELVILPVFSDLENGKVQTSYKLAYKFDIYATQPVSRGYWFIDANTGEVLLFDAIIKHAVDRIEPLTIIATVQTESQYCSQLETSFATPNILAIGTADTRYSGSQNITTSSGGLGFILKDETRGNGIHTFNANETYGSTLTDFTDADNNWTAAEFDNNAKDNASMDAHWGAEKTYDYWMEIHGRNSYDNAGATINSWVHYGPSVNNAYWNGSTMLYGDGTCVSEGCNGFDALTAIDVAGHEIGHAVTTNTANLVYARESGALNEGFSDIWGAAIEHFAKGNGSDTSPDPNVWLVGEEIDRRPGSAALRSMSDPNLLGQPDTYMGTYWIDASNGCIPTQSNDQCGVHTNSGVINHWFYLSVVGGAGTNDNGDDFYVESIGMAKASAIAFRTLNLYLSANSKYIDARIGSIQAASDLYGNCSFEVQAVTNAWHAVGVGDVFVNSCVPAIGFISTTESSLEGSDCGFIDVSIPLNIAIAASQDATVSFTVSGGSADSSDFTLMTPTVTFPAGLITEQNMILRIGSDSFLETDETIVIDLAVDPNGGDAFADPARSSLTFTILNDDFAAATTQVVDVYSENFETAPYKTDSSSSSATDWAVGDAATASSAYWTISNSNASLFAFTNDDACNCNKSNDLLWTDSFNLNGYIDATLLFDHAFSDIGSETAEVQISINGTAGPYNTLAPLSNIGNSSTPWVNDVTIDLTPYINNPAVSIRFKYNDGGGWAYGLAVDNIRVSATKNTEVQTAINTATAANINLYGVGTAYATDAVTGKIMVAIENNNADDYGCTTIAVDRAGTGAQSYNGSTGNNRVMDKRFIITSANNITSGDTKMSFYFTDAEIIGWETATGQDRSDLVIGHEVNGEIIESATTTVFNFGPDNKMLVADLGKANGSYYFGLVDAFGCGPITTLTSSGWSNGVPTSGNTVVIDADYSTATASLEGCSLWVKAGRTLTVPASSYIKIDGNIKVDGTLFIDHEGSLVQVDDNATVTNNGSITVRKVTPTLAPRSFMVLGSPMTAETRTGVYDASILLKRHITTNFFPNPDVAAAYPLAENFADDNGDDWLNYSGSINAGEGYLVYPQPDLYVGGSYIFNYTQGTLNNGEVNYAVDFHIDQNSSPNIVGNPYASAIDALKFIQDLDNDMVNTVYFWEHLTPASSSYPGYNNFNFDMGDISMFNSSGGVKAANDPGTSTTPDGYIASGQGFGFKATNAGTVKFKNDMRVTDHNDTYRREVENRNRIWLNVSNETYGLSSGMLVSFSEQSVDAYDAKYDAKRLATPLSLYSKLNTGEELAIQGRSIINNYEEIPLGFVSQVDEVQEYEISISNTDGVVWPDVQVYLIDKVSNKVHNLNSSTYTFKTTAGSQNNRFVLAFKRTVLGASGNLLETISLVPNPTKAYITILSPNATINSVEVFDIRGRSLMAVDYHGSQYSLDLSTLQSAVYFVKINTIEGSLTKRIIKD